MLRPYQQVFVDRCLAALKTHGNTLGIAPTGAGKTVMLSAIVGRSIEEGSRKALILAHRDELTQQNRDKFCRVYPGLSTSVFDAKTKDWSGQAVFAMAPTLCRKKPLKSMPKLDLAVVDEAHHSSAASYRRILDRAKALNPNIKILGVTATPTRADKKSLREIYSNCGAHITLKHLIRLGHLVPPRTFVIDVGVQEDLKTVRKIAGDDDMNDVAKIMDRIPVSEAIIQHWREKAGHRQTIVFCATVSHARHVTEAFVQAGIKAACLTGDMPRIERRQILARLKQQIIQVLVNVNVASEGFDEPSLSCVVLLRPCSQKNTLIQMIGRGLRTLNAEDYRGMTKTDCLVLDFGASVLTHGALEQSFDQDSKALRPEEDVTKECPSCLAIVPRAANECPFCDYAFALEKINQKEIVEETLAEFSMVEVDFWRRSPFRWEDLFGDGYSLVAAGFNAWAGVFFWKGVWHAIGGCNTHTRRLAAGEKIQAIAAADDWLNTHETSDAAKKTKSWLKLPPTQKQLLCLKEKSALNFGLTRYRASCLLAFTWNRKKIRNFILREAR